MPGFRVQVAAVRVSHRAVLSTWLCARVWAPWPRGRRALLFGALGVAAVIARRRMHFARHCLVVAVVPGKARKRLHCPRGPLTEMA